MYDAYISYARQDGDWARALADRLRAHGVRLFFDQCSLRPGDVVVHQLEAAIRQASHGIQVVGPLTMTHPWARQEYAALLEAASGRGLRLIPVLCGDAELPPFAATRAWVDFRHLSGATFDAKVAELAGVLRGEEPAPRNRVAPELLDLARPERPRRDDTGPAPPAFVVCYARTDAGYGERLVTHLRRHDLPAWSLGNLRWGDDYLDAIRQRLRHALAVVVLMSPDAEESEDVTREILEGQRHSRDFFPVLLRGERNYLLASSWYFDARNGALPGSDEMRLLRRLYDSRQSGRSEPGPGGYEPLPGPGGGQVPTVPPLPAPPLPASPSPAPGAWGPAAAGSTGHVSLSRLEALLAEHETEHADLLTTALLLDAVGRLEYGWMRRSDGPRLPDALLRGVDALWARYSGDVHGFSAQRRRAQVGRGRHADFLALSLRYGWRQASDETVPRYQHFTGRSGSVGFFPTLRNPLSERHLDWYDQWTETVLAVHLRLGSLRPNGTGG
ncbi:peptidase [Wenjunlia vitaminophila]|uniref:Peptidase n=1 Tax=Wenjunlia vitaminophila TaxID=76728 RepID=A0A0T6LTF8_WENVI|nr:TIR domain-containing protein [Wenjunlia vitaminophila]KRV49405.1 peptidase [Wenjunlia vitaminophila]